MSALPPKVDIRQRIQDVCVCSDRGGHEAFCGLEQVILVGRLVSDHHRVADDE